MRTTLVTKVRSFKFGNCSLFELHKKHVFGEEDLRPTLDYNHRLIIPLLIIAIEIMAQ